MARLSLHLGSNARRVSRNTLTPAGCALSHCATQAYDVVSAWGAEVVYDAACDVASPESWVWAWVCWRCRLTLVGVPAEDDACGHSPEPMVSQCSAHSI